VKVKVTVDFRERHKTLKLAFPAGAKQTISKIPFGIITRENGLGEEPCGSWIASGNLCIANDGKYGYDTTDAQKKAEELNFELRVLMDSFHDGKLPERQSCLKCDGKHIVITAVKQAEDSEETVVRLCEMDGREEQVSVEVFGKTIKTTVAHNEIKTLKTDGTEVNLIEW